MRGLLSADMTSIHIKYQLKSSDIFISELNQDVTGEFQNKSRSNKWMEQRMNNDLFS